MILRVVLAAILAGLAAGLAMAVIQHVRLTPLIEIAETFEHKSHGHSAAVTGASSVAAHSHGAETWQPEEGFERTFYTTITTMLAAVGFALMLTGVSFLTGTSITPSNGLIWGLCGFLAVSFAPALGVAPELPGMQGAELTARQVWWLGTTACTGLGLWILAHRTSLLNHAGAIVMLLLPHMLGAPKAASHDSPIPAHLAAEFVANSLGANLVMWVLIGYFLSRALAQFSDIAKT